MRQELPLPRPGGSRVRVSLPCTNKIPAPVAVFSCLSKSLTIDELTSVFYNNIVTSTPLSRKVCDMRNTQQLINSIQPAKGRYKARCNSCYGEFETDPEDMGKLVAEQRFNSQFFQPTGTFGFKIACPNCGHSIVFSTGRWISDTTEW